MPASNTSTIEDSQLGMTGQKCTHEPEPLTASGQSKQQKQDLLIIDVQHVGHAMDAFLNPGMVFNFGLENRVALASTTLGNLEIEGITNEIGHFKVCIIDVEAHTFHEHEKLFKAGLLAAFSEDIMSLKVVVVHWLSAPLITLQQLHTHWLITPRPHKGSITCGWVCVMARWISSHHNGLSSFMRTAQYHLRVKICGLASYDTNSWLK
ncbi:hypothetical protein JB92DRAFT_2826782 [Gautieria morchelliformis]|nr:hypothetical protein JB92DRAFT_2826782 [Gautieria morchelliformis]